MAKDNPSPKADAIQVMLGLGHPGDETLLVRVSPQAAAEMRELMKAEGVFSGDVMQFSARSDLFILAGSVAGGLGGLAAVLKAYFQRNRHKGVTFSYEDVSVEIKGYSDEEADRLIDQVLEEMQDKQRQRDEEWRRISDQNARDHHEN